MTVPLCVTVNERNIDAKRVRERDKDWERLRETQTQKSALLLPVAAMAQQSAVLSHW